MQTCENDGGTSGRTYLAAARRDMTAPVLVVDDDGDSRTLLATLLTLRGYAVVTASNGAEALAVARHHHPSLILLDWMMPVMDGEEFRANQLADASLAGIPVILVSARHQAEEKAREMGVACCIRKPFQFEQLTTVVDQIVASGGG
jgi:CheY-like chemotaxis protein